MSIARKLASVQSYAFGRGDQFAMADNGPWVLREHVAEALGVKRGPDLPRDCPACPHGNKPAPGAPVCADCMPDLARAIHLSAARRAGAEDHS